MANLTFATVKIATKEDLNNVFIFSLFKKLATEKPFRFVNIILSKNREYVIVNYIPSLDFDIYELVEEIYKNGEVIFEEEYPYVIFEEEGEMDDEGGYPIDKEATKAIRNKLEADKKEWFPTLYQKSEHLNSDGENIVWRPSSEEVAKEPSEKLTEKEKRLLSSMLEYLQTIGFVDVDGEEEDGLDEEELEAKTAQKIQVIQDKILGKGFNQF